MNTPHTPLPWRYQFQSAADARMQANDGTDGGGASGFIFAGPKGLGSVVIAHLPHHRDPAEDAEREANAAFIVRAVNSHDELVEALEDMLSARVDPMGIKAANADKKASAILSRLSA